MSKRSSDPEFRRALADALLAAILSNNLTKSKAAELLGVERQTLWLYLKGKATPGGEVLRKAFQMWDLKIALEGYGAITKESFGPKPEPDKQAAEQLNLLDQLERLSSDQMEVAPLGRHGEYFEFRIRIRATTKVS